MNNKGNSEEDKLRALTGERNPFNVPSDYFESLPGKIRHAIELIPSADKVSTSNPFMTPEGYFNSLPSAISDKISERIKSKQSVFAIFLRPRIVLTLSLALILIVAGMYYMFRIHEVDRTKQELTSDEIRKSLYLYSVEEDLIIDALPDNQSETNDKSLEQYLIDNDIDLSQIINEL